MSRTSVRRTSSFIATRRGPTAPCGQATSRISPTISPRVLRTGRRRNSSSRGGSASGRTSNSCSTRSTAGNCARWAPSSTLTAMPMPLLGNRDAVHALGADLGDHATVGLFDEHRVEAIGAADEKRPRAHRVNDARRDRVVRSRRRARAATRREPCSRAAARTPRRRIRRPPARVGLRRARPTSPRSRGSSAARGGRAARSRRSASPRSARAPASRRAFRSSCCAVRVSRAPDSRSSFIPRGDSGSCGPQARSPSSSPMSRSMPVGDGDVLRLAAVRRAGQRELVVAPAQRRRSRRTRGAA